MIRWSRLGVFSRIFTELAGKTGDSDRIMIEALPEAKGLPADQGYDVDRFHAYLTERGCTPCILSKTNRKVMIRHGAVLYC